MLQKVRISGGNMKLGKICSVSTSPISGCVPTVPCSRECYAMKAYRLRPVVKKAWDNNLAMVMTQRELFFSQISEYLNKNMPRFFRWFVGGDIIDQDFLAKMNKLALEYPNTRFLSFTKNHDLDFTGLTSNLVIIASMWPKWGNPNIPLPKAWMQDGTETRVPSDAMECTGACDKCNMCWHLPSINRDVVFHKH